MNTPITERNWGIKNYSNNQIGSVVTLMIIAVWGVMVLWTHTRNPAGMDPLELTFVGTLTIIFWILVPFYWKRVRWSYIIHIGLVIGGLGGGMSISLLDRTLHFSISLYNIITLIVYITAILSVFLSIRAFQELN